MAFLGKQTELQCMRIVRPVQQDRKVLLKFSPSEQANTFSLNACRTSFSPTMVNPFQVALSIITVQFASPAFSTWMERPKEQFDSPFFSSKCIRKRNFSPLLSSCNRLHLTIFLISYVECFSLVGITVSASEEIFPCHYWHIIRLIIPAFCLATSSNVKIQK